MNRPDVPGLSRRSFLTAAGAAALMPLLPDTALAAGRKLEKIGIQLYTVRDLLGKDMPGTLNALAGMGYDQVEFFDYAVDGPGSGGSDLLFGGHTAKDVRRYLQDAGLQSVSGHIGPPRVKTPDVIERTLDYFQAIGLDYMVLAILNGEDRKTLDQFKRHAELFNRAGEAARKRGMRFGYHNHNFEFVPIDGATPYDVLLQGTDPDLVAFTMDLHWITRAGADPLAYFAKYPGRFHQCHVKDLNRERTSFADVGDGVVDFARIFAQSDKAGFRNYYVERDDAKEPLVTARRSLDYLRRLRF